MQVVCGLRLSYLPKIKRKHISYFKQYLGAVTCPISLHNFSTMKIQEITAIKPPNPQQARIDGLKRQKENVSKQLKAEKARQSMAKAQKQMANINSLA